MSLNIQKNGHQNSIQSVKTHSFLEISLLLAEESLQLATCPQKGLFYFIIQRTLLGAHLKAMGELS